MNAWDRQPEESPKAFAAFTMYCDLGVERSCVSVARELGKSKTLIERWCSRFDWVSRVAQFDDWLRTRRVEKSIAAREAMCERHADDALKLLEQIRPHLNLRRKKITPTALGKLFEAACRIERLARGEPDDEQVAAVNIHVYARGDKPDYVRASGSEEKQQ